MEDSVKKQMLNSALVLVAALALCPRVTWAQDAPDDDPPIAQGPTGTAGPQGVQQATTVAQEFIRRFHIGGVVGSGLDPELIQFGGHALWGPYFKNSFDFRPGVDVGIGELTTLFAANFDLLYRFPQALRPRWTPYVGGGFNY